VIPVRKVGWFISSFCILTAPCADAQNAVIQQFGNTVLVIRDRIDDLNGLTVNQFIKCLQHEYMPADPSGTKRKVYFSGDQNDFVVSFENNGGTVNFHLSPSTDETMVTSIAVSGSTIGPPVEIDDWQAIAYELPQFLQTCKF